MRIVAWLGVILWTVSIACPRADAGDKVYLAGPPTAISFDAPSAHALQFSLDGRQDPSDIAFRLERDGDKHEAPSASVALSVNGHRLSTLSVASHDFYTVRIPRLFLNAGANDLTLTLRSNVTLALKPLQFLTHELVIGPAPQGPGLVPQPELWGEPRYDWHHRRVVLWVAVQGRGRQLVENAEVAVEVAGQTLPMKPTTAAGRSALERAVRLRYEAAIPFEKLYAASNPARVHVAAPGYRPIQQWFALPGPADPGPTARPRLDTVVLTMSRPDRSYEMPFVLMVPPHVSPPPAPQTTDYQGLMEWVQAVQGSGGRVLLDRGGQDLRSRFGDFAYLIDADGLVLLDDGGWDSGAEPQGLWDRMLHQGLRVEAMSARSTAPAPRHAATLREGDIDVELSVNGSEPRQIASVEFSKEIPITVRARTQKTGVRRILVISNLGRDTATASRQALPGQILAEHTPIARPESPTPAGSVTFESQVSAVRPGYIRAIAEGEDGSRAMSGPVFIEVRPAAGDGVITKLGECRLFEGPSIASPKVILNTENAAQLLPVRLGAAGCRELRIPFVPPQTSHYILELGLDPGQTFDGTGERVDVRVSGRPAGSYRAANPIHGDRARHIVPFRISLGELSTGAAAQIELHCPAAGDGIGLAYAYLIRASMPAMALVDLHSHSKSSDAWSNSLHRTMAYNYISTGHGAISSADWPGELARVRELSDDQLTIHHGGERGDRFGAMHMSLGFLDPPLGGQYPPSSGYGSVIPLGIDAGGLAAMNHPSQDRQLSFLTGETTWGTNDPHFHGFAAWTQYQNALGEGDHYWRLLTHFEYFNGYSTIGVASGSLDSNPIPRIRWHEQIGRYVRGQRRSPLFGLGNSDTKTFQQQSQWHIGNMYMGTMVHAASLHPGDIKAALIAGNATISGHVDTRLLVSVTDSQGRVYLPGQHLIGESPFKVRVAAWSPRPLADVHLVGPGGTIDRRALSGHHIVEEFTLQSLGPFDWFLVEVAGRQPATGAVSNPFLRRPHH